MQNMLASKCYANALFVHVTPMMTAEQLACQEIDIVSL